MKRGLCCNKWLEKVFLDWRHPGRRRVLGWERRQAENWRTKLGRLRLAWLPNHLTNPFLRSLDQHNGNEQRAERGREGWMVWIVLLIAILFSHIFNALPCLSIHREVLLREVMPATMGAFRPANTSQLAIPHLRRGGEGGRRSPNIAINITGSANSLRPLLLCRAIHASCRAVANPMNTNSNLQRAFSCYVQCIDWRLNQS